MAGLDEIFEGSCMDMPVQPRATERFRQLCADFDIRQAAITRKLGLSATTVNYYFLTSGRFFKKQYLPLNQDWSEPLQRYLIEKGCPIDRVLELFRPADIGGGHDFSREIAKMRAQIHELQEKTDTPPEP